MRFITENNSLTFICFLIFCLFLLSQCKKEVKSSSDVSEDVNTVDSGEVDDSDVGFEDSVWHYDDIRFPIDMVLIYHGGSGSMPWTKNQIKPYVYREKDNKIQWLFDGFLFLELSTNYYGTTYYFDGDSERGDAMANKTVWKELLRKTFYNGHGPGGIENVFAQLAKEKIYSPYKRKVVISIPYPVYKNKTWGKLNGESLDFGSNFARLQAVSWFIDQVLKYWKARHYKYIELAGFYWLREEAFSSYDRQLIPKIKQYIKNINVEKGTHYDFYWIPYNGAGHAEDWRDLGFDIAYYQPNYFFSTDYPYSNLTGAIDFAKLHNMGMEMEFNGKLYGGNNQAAYRQRFYDYINEFSKNGIWNKKRIAYYEGGGAWLKMSKEENKNIQNAYDTLANILVERKKDFKQFK